MRWKYLQIAVGGATKMEGFSLHISMTYVLHQNIKIHNIYDHAYRQFIIRSNTILTHFAGCEWAECQNALFLPCGYCFPSRFQFTKTKKNKIDINTRIYPNHTDKAIDVYPWIFSGKATK